MWAIAACLGVSALDALVLVVEPGRVTQAEDALAALVGQASTASAHTSPVRWRVGTPAVSIRLSGASADRLATLGARRRGAALAGVAGLQMLVPDCEWVVIHEATRPLASAALIQAGLAAAIRANMGAVASEPVKETLKRAPDGVGGRVAETLPRAALARAQTPQVYRVADLLAALRRLPPGADPADEATVAFAAGLPLITFPSGHDNLKVTSRADLPIVEAALRQRQ